MMQVLNNLKRYTPEAMSDAGTENAALAADVFSMTGMPVIFLRDENGTDWYESQKKFSADTLKIAIDENGLIRQFSLDVSTIMPEGLSVRELKASSQPAGLDVDGSWKFSKGKISRVELTQAQLVAAAKQDRQSRLQAITLLIDSLSDAAALGRASDEQNALLLACRNYRVDLLNINCDAPAAIVWPEVPEGVA